MNGNYLNYYNPNHSLMDAILQIHIFKINFQFLCQLKKINHLKDARHTLPLCFVMEFYADYW